MLRNVLILSAGRRVELLLGFQKSLTRWLPDGEVCCADLEPMLSSACMATERRYKLPHCRSPEYKQALTQLCADQGIAMVIPTIDTELMILAQMEPELRAHGTHAIISDANIIAGCRDKRKTPELFAKLGLASPQIYSHDMIEFPCFSKPADGSSSIGAMRIDHESQITDEMHSDPNRMFMQLVPEGLRELTIDLYYDQVGNLCCAVPRERLAVRAGEVAKGVTRKDWVYEKIIAAGNSLPGARGCLTLQLFADDNDKSLHAIEINPRFGGGYPLSLAAGADFPGWLIHEYLLKRKVEFFDSWESDLLMLRYDANVLVHGYG
jgi:carbamoyl-phosphate synthase large subunit